MSARSSVRRPALLPITTAPRAMPTAAIDPMMLNSSNVFMVSGSMGFSGQDFTTAVAP